ncbi:MAG: hypothetical protein ACP5LX_06895 [Nitrososphaeria archaeon]
MSLAAVDFILPVGPAWSSYDSSWAIGIVVPQNAALKNGSVDWKTVVNVTSIFNVPNISYTDRTIYIIMSAMTLDGSIMQVAIALYNNSNLWNGYATYILKPKAFPQNYVQIPAAKNISIMPGHIVSMKLFFKDSWWFSIEDLDTGKSVVGRFDANISSELAPGGQYIFALESYSYSYNVFSHMGRLLLYNVFINGKPIKDGWYVYSSWVKQPLFIVGDSNPPQFISVQRLANATLEWTAND